MVSSQCCSSKLISSGSVLNQKCELVKRLLCSVPRLVGEVAPAVVVAFLCDYRHERLDWPVATEGGEHPSGLSQMRLEDRTVWRPMRMVGGICQHLNVGRERGLEFRSVGIHERI